jgi:hypothetical protein
LISEEGGDENRKIDLIEGFHLFFVHPPPLLWEVDRFERVF